jgi:chromosomal replication initiator protein
MTGTLVPEYTFATFAIDSRNRFSHAAAVAAAEAPGKAYNPLFLHGGLRPARTHLLHAVGNYARDLHPSLEIRYVRAPEFGSEIATEDGRQDGSRGRFLDVGMLLVDDLQLLPDSEAIQAEFLHVLTAMLDCGKQLVISCDRAPGRLACMNDSLRARLGQGLVMEVMHAE